MLLSLQLLNVLTPISWLGELDQLVLSLDPLPLYY